MKYAIIDQIPHFQFFETFRKTDSRKNTQIFRNLTLANLNQV